MKQYLIDNKRVFLLLSCIFSGVLGVILYFFFGYTALIPFLWVLSMILAGSYFYKKPCFRWEERYKTDLFISIFLLILFIPLYFYSIYTLPFQMNIDEIAIMDVQKHLVNHDSDLFKLSDFYYGLPSFIFIVTGWMAELMGGVSLLNSRMVHAFFGLLIVPCSYFFFRNFTPKKLAIAGAIIIGTNHSLVAISRMAMRENIALLFGVLALAFLLYGLRKKSFLHIFIGGCITGLSWYGYYPGRSTIVVWFIFLAFLAVFFRSNTNSKIF